MIAQGAHAACNFLVDRIDTATHLDEVPYLTIEEKEWIKSGMAKIAVRVESLEQLNEIVEKANLAGLTISLITDAGHTEFNGVPTITAAAIGPNLSQDIDLITGELKLL